MSNALPVQSAAGWGIVIGLALLTTGCGGTIGRAPLVGEPTHIPAPPAVQPEYPAVGASTSTRTTKPMTAAERTKVEADIARDRQQGVAERRKKIKGQPQKKDMQKKDTLE